MQYCHPVVKCFIASLKQLLMGNTLWFLQLVIDAVQLPTGAKLIFCCSPLGCTTCGLESLFQRTRAEQHPWQQRASYTVLTGLRHRRVLLQSVVKIVEAAAVGHQQHRCHLHLGHLLISSPVCSNSLWDKWASSIIQPHRTCLRHCRLSQTILQQMTKSLFSDIHYFCLNLIWIKKGKLWQTLSSPDYETAQCDPAVAQQPEKKLKVFEPMHFVLFADSVLRISGTEDSLAKIGIPEG